RVEELAEAQRRTEQRVEELAEAQRRTEETLRASIARQDRMERKLDSLVGDQLERRYREKAHSYFGRFLRRVRAVAFYEIEEQVEKRLAEAELDELRLLDLLVRGHLREKPELPEVWLTIEVSATVDRGDVERARRRAALLRKAGYLAVPVVAGEDATQGGAQAASEEHVVLLQDGTVEFWDQALEQALA
ncbi:MAG: hypothetical protein RML36_16160, partial [Anaerolineae bacterium]|nr:hypothetical protein [Anaerolineae bacterium]